MVNIPAFHPYHGRARAKVQRARDTERTFLFPELKRALSGSPDKARFNLNDEGYIQLPTDNRHHWLRKNRYVPFYSAIPEI
jgi:hypothetical protein